LGDNLSEPKPTAQTAIVSIQKMMEEQGETLNNAIEYNSQLCVQNAELMDANWDDWREMIEPEAMKKKTSDMTQPEQYWGGA